MPNPAYVSRDRCAVPPAPAANCRSRLGRARRHPCRAGVVLATKLARDLGARGCAPRIARLADRRDYAAALHIAQEAHGYIPTNRQLAELWPEISAELSITTNVPGADVRFKEYSGDSEWRLLGPSPIKGARVSRGLKRWQIVTPGFQTVDAAASPESDGPTLQFALDKEGSLPPGMVRVPGGTFLIWITRPRSSRATALGGLPHRQI